MVTIEKISTCRTRKPELDANLDAAEAASARDLQQVSPQQNHCLLLTTPT